MKSLRRRNGLLCLALFMSVPSPASGQTTGYAPVSPWSEFARRAVDRWLAIDPAFAVYQGDHRYDGKLPDWSAAGLKARRDYLRSIIAQGEAYQLTGPDAFERDYLVQVARGQLFWLEDADEPHSNPSFYVDGGLDPNVYVSRDYAAKPVRMKAMIDFFEAVPQAARNIRANLRTPMPQSFIKYGVSAFSGFAAYYRGDARTAFSDVKDPALQAQFHTASESAGKAMADLANWLQAQQSTATQDFALGPEKFARMLKATEAVDTPLNELVAIGRADLARNRAALQQACAAFTPGKSVQQCFARLNNDKPAEGPVVAATKQIPYLTAFIQAKDLVSMPGTEVALVRESPPYNRQNSAYIDPPGSFEKGIPSIYYISPPDPAWSKEKQAEYIPGKYDLLFTTVHEVMPGHFLQFLHSNRSPSLIGRLFVGYAFAEGWAHYGEELVLEAGLGGNDAGVRVGQLSNALLRDCRFISAIGMHAQGMTQAQSEAMFKEECYQGAGTAEQQAARGTYDPAYLNYTLGKLMIRRLRTDWTADRGGQKVWKQFHDQFLSYGGPPIPLVRQAMMKESAPHSAF